MKNKIYKLWLHVEEVILNESGKTSAHQNLDHEFMPVTVSVCMHKSKILDKMLSIENHDEAIEFCQKILVGLGLILVGDEIGWCETDF